MQEPGHARGRFRACEMPGPGRLQAVLPPVDPAQGRWRTPPSQRPRCPVGFAVGSPGQSTRKLNRGSTCPGTAEGAHVARAAGEGRALLCSPPPPPATQRHLGADRRCPLSGAPWGPGGRWLLIHRVSWLFLRGLRGRPSSGHAPRRPLGLSFVPPVFMFSPVAEVVFQRHVIHRAPPNPQ